jgi:hypothetical protein
MLEPTVNKEPGADQMAESTTLSHAVRAMAPRNWQRIAYKLRGEALRFATRVLEESFEGLLIGVTDEGFLVFDPEHDDSAPILAPFGEVRGLTPLSEVRASELRAAYERCPAAA